MNYHNIVCDDMLNGEGLRVTLFVSGCDHHCKGCQNPQTHDFNSGIWFGRWAEDELFKKLDKPHISGLTLSGGDPLYVGNRYKITELCKKFKERFPNKTIWLYTGYLYEQIYHLELMEYIDVLVDGPFIQELADENYPWAGSTNQRVIYLKGRNEQREEDSRI